MTNIRRSTYPEPDAARIAKTLTQGSGLAILPLYNPSGGTSVYRHFMEVDPKSWNIIRNSLKVNTQCEIVFEEIMKTKVLQWSIVDLANFLLNLPHGDELGENLKKYTRR